MDREIAIGYALFTANAMAFGLIMWAVLCRKSLSKRRLTVADLLAPLLVICVVLGVCS